MYVVLADGDPVGTTATDPTPEQRRTLRLRLRAETGRPELKVSIAQLVDGDLVVSWPGGHVPAWLDVSPVRVGVGGPARARKQRTPPAAETVLSERVNVRFLPGEMARLEAAAGADGVGPLIRRIVLAYLP